MLPATRNGPEGNTNPAVCHPEGVEVRGATENCSRRLYVGLCQKTGCIIGRSCPSVEQGRGRVGVELLEEGVIRLNHTGDVAPVKGDGGSHVHKLRPFHTIGVEPNEVRFDQGLDCRAT